MNRFLLALSGVVAVTALALACRDVRTGPVTPPTHAAPSATPRFDGVYLAVRGDGRDLVRFVDGGRVLGISVGSTGVLQNAVTLLFGESDRCAKGTYEIKDGVIRFTLKNKAGAVEYAGAIDGAKLGVRWRSEINGGTEEVTYDFAPVQARYLVLADAGATSAPVASEEPPDAAPAPAATASTEPPAFDATLVPEGSGWVCFRVASAGGPTGGSRCERKAPACEAARKTAVGVWKDARVGKCGKQPNAYCFSVQRASGRGAASCSLSQADCDAERAGVVADTDNVEVGVSACVRQ